jgi:DNA-binding MarR family transcriptional regulator
VAAQASTVQPLYSIQRAEEVRLALRRIIRAIDLHSSSLARSYGLTGPQLAVLRVLAEQKEEMTGSGLARAASISHATVTGIVGRLEARGLIERQRSGEDRRSTLLHLTDHGREVALEAPPLLAEAFLRRFEALPDWEQTQMVSALQRIAAMMEPDESQD